MIIKKTEDFYETVVEDFCNKRNIEKSFKSFFSHKSSGANLLPDCVGYIRANLISPYVLFHSKAFFSMMKSLEEDFAKEIYPTTNLDIISLKLEVESSPKFKKFLKNILGDDFHDSKWSDHVL